MQLDIVVFGRACANHIKENLDAGKPHKKMADDAGMQSIEDFDKIRKADGPKHTSEIRLDMQKAMQSDAAVFRTQESLDEGVRKMDEIYKSFDQVGIKDRSMIWNTDLTETLECKIFVLIPFDDEKTRLILGHSAKPSHQRVPDSALGCCPKGVQRRTRSRRFPRAR